MIDFDSVWARAAPAVSVKIVSWLFNVPSPSPHLHLSRSLADRWGTTVDFTTNFLHSSQFSAFRSVMFHSRPVHSLMLSSHRFLCLPLRLPPCTVPCGNRLVGLVVTASASRPEDARFESRLLRDFFGVESYQWLQNWHSSSYPARRLVL